MNDEKFGATHHLRMPSDARPMPVRPTGPLDELIPWVIEFRVVGTTHMIRVPATEEIIIGRGDPKRGIVPDVDLTPYAAHVLGVSRQHARVAVQRDRITIQDLNSANGTFVNGHILSPDQEYRLRHGDQLSFGQLHLQVQFVVTPGSEVTEAEDSPREVNIPVVGNGERVLVVDDDAEVAQTIGSVFERAGFQVMVATTAVDALNSLTSEMPDALVLELVLPDMDGLELVRYVRRHDAERRVPIIAILGTAGGFQSGKAREAGVDVVLGKPLSIDQIVQAIRSIVPFIQTG